MSDGGVVVVTGAAQGIGAATAALLARGGRRVVATDLGDEAPADLAEGVEYRRLDVTSADDWAALVAALSGGPVHGLVNNAGATWRARLPDVAVADMVRTYEVNVCGAVLGIQALTPLMAAGSSIVCVGSVAALTGHFPIAYTASKWALRGLARAAATELGPLGIRVNTVHPGFVETPMTRVGRAELPGREPRPHPAGPGRRAGRDRLGHRLPAQRRGVLPHRQRDRRRRRADRARRDEGGLRRRPFAVPPVDRLSRRPVGSHTGGRPTRTGQPRRHMEHTMNKPVWVVVGVIMALAGTIFTLQGLNVLTGSGMSDSTFWSVAGPVVILLGLAVAGLGVRGRVR